MDPNLVMTTRDLSEWNQCMSVCTNTTGGFIERFQNNNPHHPNHTLCHLSMPEAGLNPTDCVEPLLGFNWTGNPRLSRWWAGYKLEKDWVSTLLVDLVDTTNCLLLIPHILASFQQMSLESKFPSPRRPYNDKNISFTTQEHMFPPRSLRQGRTLSITYLVFKEFMSELSR